MKIRKFLAGFLSAAMVAGACTVGASAAAPAEPTGEERCAAAIENYVEEKFKTNAKDPNSDLWATLEDAVNLYIGTPKVGKYTIDVGLDAITLQKEGVDQTLILKKSNVIAAAKNYAAVLADKTFPSNDLRDTIKTYLDTTEGNILLTHLLEPDYNFQEADITAVLNDTKFRDELCDAVWSIVFRKATLGDALNSLTDDDADSVKDFLGAIGKTISNDTKLSEIFVNKQNFKDLYDIFVGNDIFTGHFNPKAENALNNIQNALNPTPSTPGGGSVVPTNPTQPDDTYVSDTTNDITVNGAYTFKITSKNGKAPVFAVGTPGVFNVTLDKVNGNDYFYKVTAIGAVGAKAGIYINGGSRLLVATVGSTAASQTYVSDTTHDFSVDGAYTFKITSKNGKKPVFVVGTPGIFITQLVKQSGNDYFFKITAIGKPGQSAGIYINGESRLLVATVKSNAYYVSDTTYDLTVDKAYTFKITSKNGKTPTFAVGTPGVFDIKLVKQTGSDYFFKITAVGKSGSQTGIYIDGCPRLLVATVK